MTSEAKKMTRVVEVDSLLVSLPSVRGKSDKKCLCVWYGVVAVGSGGGEGVTEGP